MKYLKSEPQTPHAATLTNTRSGFPYRSSSQTGMSRIDNCREASNTPAGIVACIGSQVYIHRNHRRYAGGVPGDGEQKRYFLEVGAVYLSSPRTDEPAPTQP